MRALVPGILRWKRRRRKKVACKRVVAFRVGTVLRHVQGSNDWDTPCGLRVLTVLGTFGGHEPRKVREMEIGGGGLSHTHITSTHTLYQSILDTILPVPPRS